jgi:rubrerythrin
MNKVTVSKLDAAIGKAIENERYGRHFYLMAAGSTLDEKGRAVFEQLAGEERDHEVFLTGQLKSLRETGKLDAASLPPKAAELRGDSPIFSESMKARAKEAHAEMSAIGVGIQIEISSEKFYRDLASSSKDESVKKIFAFLADWESGHYHALLRQQEDLRQGYWFEGGFSPF